MRSIAKSLLNLAPTPQSLADTHSVTLLSALLLCCSLAAWSQPPDSLWSRTYGLENADAAQRVLATDDGGFLIAGRVTNEQNQQALWLIKCDAQGDSEWTSQFTGSLSSYVYDLIPTADGGYALAGSTYSFGGGDMLLIKTDANGNEEWTRHYGLASAEDAHGVVQTADGGFVLAGSTQSYTEGDLDYFMIRTNSVGDSLAGAHFGGPEFDYAQGIALAGDDAVMLAGISRSYGAGADDIWVVKASLNGDSLWSRTFGGGAGEQARTIIQTSDGGYLMGGQAQSFGARAVDMWVVKMAANGDSLWSELFGGNLFDHCWGLAEAHDGGFLVTGYSNSWSGGEYDFFIVKIDADGDSLWSRTFGGAAADQAYHAAQTGDLGYVIVGATESFGAGSSDWWIVKTGPDLIDYAGDVSVVVPAISTLECYPNPFNATTQIKLELSMPSNGTLMIYDVLGNEVRTLLAGPLTAGTHAAYLNADNLSSGMYYARWESPRYTTTQKIVLIR